MYSRHLEYSQPANRARQLCLIENEQKDIVISTLKAELFPLRNLELQFHQLNDQITLLEERYSMLIAERDRAQKEQRVKSDLDRNAIIEMKAEIDVLRGHLQRITLDIQEAARANITAKRMSDARANQIQGLLNEQRDLQNKNQRQLQQNKGLGLNIKALKDERKKLQDDCDSLSGLLEQNINRFKLIERNVRNAESANTRLQKTLGQAQNDHDKLQIELKQKSQDFRRAQNRDKEANLALEQLKGTFGSLMNQLQKNNLEVATAEAALSVQVSKGKDLMNRIGAVQINIRQRQDELEKIAWQQNKLRTQHNQRLQDNRLLNGQIDRLLALVHEYQLVNSQLLDEIQLYIQQDQQARKILDRRSQMTQVVQKVLFKVNSTGQSIKHIKTHFDH